MACGAAEDDESGSGCAVCCVRRGRSRSYRGLLDAVEAVRGFGPATRREPMSCWRAAPGRGKPVARIGALLQFACSRFHAGRTEAPVRDYHVGVYCILLCVAATTRIGREPSWSPGRSTGSGVLARALPAEPGAGLEHSGAPGQRDGFQKTRSDLWRRPVAGELTAELCPGCRGRAADCGPWTSAAADAIDVGEELAAMSGAPACSARLRNCRCSDGSVSEIHRRLLQTASGAFWRSSTLKWRNCPYWRPTPCASIATPVIRLVQIPRHPRARGTTDRGRKPVRRPGAFPSASQFSSWIGVCPGREESAGGKTTASHCAKGNTYMRRVVCLRRRRRR